MAQSVDTSAAGASAKLNLLSNPGVNGQLIPVPDARAGQAREVESSHGGILVMPFDPFAAEARLEGENLVFEKDGGTVTITGFCLVTGDSLPHLRLPDGTHIKGDVFLSRVGLEPMFTAADGVGGQVRLNPYADGAGELYGFSSDRLNAGNAPLDGGAGDFTVREASAASPGVSFYPPQGAPGLPPAASPVTPPVTPPATPSVNDVPLVNADSYWVVSTALNSSAGALDVDVGANGFGSLRWAEETLQSAFRDRKALVNGQPKELNLEFDRDASPDYFRLVTVDGELAMEGRLTYAGGAASYQYTQHLPLQNSFLSLDLPQLASVLGLNTGLQAVGLDGFMQSLAGVTGEEALRRVGGVEGILERLETLLTRLDAPVLQGAMRDLLTDMGLLNQLEQMGLADNLLNPLAGESVLSMLAQAGNVANMGLGEAVKYVLTGMELWDNLERAGLDDDALNLLGDRSLMDFLGQIDLPGLLNNLSGAVGLSNGPLTAFLTKLAGLDPDVLFLNDNGFDVAEVMHCLRGLIDLWDSCDLGYILADADGDEAYGAVHILSGDASTLTGRTVALLFEDGLRDGALHKTAGLDIDWSGHGAKTLLWDQAAITAEAGFYKAFIDGQEYALHAEFDRGGAAFRWYAQVGGVNMLVAEGVLMLEGGKAAYNYTQNYAFKNVDGGGTSPMSGW